MTVSIGPLAASIAVALALSSSASAQSSLSDLDVEDLMILVLILDSTRSSGQHAVYVQDETGLARWLIVNAGLRYDGTRRSIESRPARR
jgi:outer membrane receptor protein involved in Fe transport